MPAIELMSAAMYSQRPIFASSCCFAFRTSSRRATMYTLAPKLTKPSAIMAPMPTDPPVTNAIFPSSENRSFIGSSSRRWSIGAAMS